MDAIGITCILFGVGAVVLVIYTLLSDAAFKEKQRRENERKAEEERRKKESLVSALKNGQWEFPAREFYMRCAEKGIKNLDDKFYLQKARLLAEELFQKHGIPVVHRANYSTDELLTKAFNEAKEAIEKEEAEKKALERKKQEEWDRTPHTGKCSKEESQAIMAARKISQMKGTQKRRALLEDNLALLKQKIDDDAAAKRAMKILGAAISDAAYVEKPKDWAVAGGIASAIAGPAAGVAVAMNAMEENKAIAARNEANRNAAMALGSSVEAAAMTIGGSDMGTKYLATEAEIEALKEKVVLDDVSSAELEKLVEITSCSAIKNENNVVKVTFDLKNNFVADVPEDVRIVVDGMYVAEIFAGDTCVGQVDIPLPLYGVECGKTAQVTGYCTKYMEEEQEYTVKIKKASLWAMEL